VSFSNDTNGWRNSKWQKETYTDEIEEIREWALNCDIKQAALDKLLLNYYFEKKITPPII